MFPSYRYENSITKHWTFSRCFMIVKLKMELAQKFGGQGRYFEAYKKWD
jgi:hypothetical protein